MAPQLHSRRRPVLILPFLRSDGNDSVLRVRLYPDDVRVLARHKYFKSPTYVLLTYTLLGVAWAYVNGLRHAIVPNPVFKVPAACCWIPRKPALSSCRRPYTSLVTEDRRPFIAGPIGVYCWSEVPLNGLPGILCPVTNTSGADIDANGVELTWRIQHRPTSGRFKSYRQTLLVASQSVQCSGSMSRLKRKYHKGLLDKLHDIK